MHEPLIKNRILPRRERIEKRKIDDLCVILSSYNNANFSRSLNAPYFFFSSSFPLETVYIYRYDGCKQSYTLQRDSRRSRPLIRKVEKGSRSYVTRVFISWKNRNNTIIRIINIFLYGIFCFHRVENPDSNTSMNLNSWKNLKHNIFLIKFQTSDL